jgi:hypothetical protein
MGSSDTRASAQVCLASLIVCSHAIHHELRALAFLRLLFLFLADGTQVRRLVAQNASRAEIKHTRLSAHVVETSVRDTCTKRSAWFVEH